MQRFEEAENFDVEGVDNKNACYGGTAALMNTINWVESSSWDGRFGIVVCAGSYIYLLCCFKINFLDIAVYAAGPARPTGGAGAVALLVGPNAPLVVSPIRQNFFKHSFDFYKPDLTSGNDNILTFWLKQIFRIPSSRRGTINQAVLRSIGQVLPGLAHKIKKYERFHTTISGLFQEPSNYF